MAARPGPPGPRGPNFPEPALQPGSGLSFPWAFITRNGHEASWGGAGQRIVERMIIPYTNYVQSSGNDGAPPWQIAQSELCGYAYTDPADASKFIRVLPWRHPQFPHLYIDAEQGISSVKPVGPPVKVQGGPFGPYVQYLYIVLTLLFTEKRYDVIGGVPSATGGALQPFLEFMDKGTAEYLALNTGSYEFDPNEPSIPNGIKGTDFRQGLAVLDAKDTFVMRWHLVPHKWLHNKFGIASNIIGGLSKVNSDNFMGFVPGQLFFDSHDKERKSYPILPIKNGAGVPDITTTWAWDVTLYFKFRNPPTTPALMNNPMPNKFGHNLAPTPQDPNGLWYPIVSKAVNGNGGGSPLYQSGVFGQIFAQAGPQ